MDKTNHSRAQNWTTNLVQPTERFAYYREVVCQAFMKMTPEAPAAPEFSASGQSIALGTGALNRVVVYPPHRTLRTIADVKAADRRGFYLNYRLAGRSLVQQAGIDMVASPGQVCLIDSDRPFSLTHHPARSTSVTSFWMPAEALYERLEPSFDIKPARLSDDPHVGPLITETARTLNLHALQMSPDDAGRLFEALLDLVALALSCESRSTIRESSSVADATTLAVKRAIEVRLNKPGLRVSDIAAAVGISERYVHMLFARAGTTFRDHVMQRRLDSVAASLRAPEFASADIGAIAFEWGFADLSHFTRNFRKRFGMRPRDWRTP
ncbi:helix-turn-helix domain-containing protein [Bradyrhizobium sp. NBAIM14]|uniref:helix-turn-helix domain-containing protein n=1 Tax=Bradyrhizobium sp. NBAIM14 TaxID=2793814 RepID=UPI001CD52CD2|nr:helix-turn-helix domain-containing protein [Bradyrhizobium sp. NBAIM14]MCA1500095.1 helix-turn-helix domain-containing protein [Bradyrhizobium sp. NBAIM14]